MSQTYHLSDVEEQSVILKSNSPLCPSLTFFFTPITQDMFAWHPLRLIHSDSFLFLLHVECNRNCVPGWKTLFTNVAAACPAWSSVLFPLRYMAGNRSWLGLAHVLPPPSSLKTAKFNHPDYCTLFTLCSLSQRGLQPYASFHANTCGTHLNGPKLPDIADWNLVDHACAIDWFGINFKIWLN